MISTGTKKTASSWAHGVGHPFGQAVNPLLEA